MITRLILLLLSAAALPAQRTQPLVNQRLNRPLIYGTPIYDAGAYASIGAAITAVGTTTGSWDGLSTGGAVVYVPCGTYTESITLKSNVSLVGEGDCAIIRATGASVSIITLDHIYKASVSNLTLDINSNNSVKALDLVSAQANTFRDIRIVGGSGTTGGIAIALRATGTTSPTDNTTFNDFENIRAEIGPTRAIVLQGNSASGGVVTLNSFRQVRATGSGSPMIDFVSYADHNYFTDVNMSSSSSGVQGIVLNSGSPSVEYGVGGNRFRNIVCEGAPATGTCVTAAYTTENVIDGLRSFWPTPYSHSVNTATTTVRNILPNGASWHQPTEGLILGATNDGTALVMPRTDVTLSNGVNEDIDPGTSSYIRIMGPTGAFSLGGFSGGADGKHLHVFNSTSQAMTIKNLSAGSLAANRILTHTGADITLRAGSSVISFIYSSADSLWILAADEGVPTYVVTTDTAQTISGAKTFTNDLSVSWQDSVGTAISQLTMDGSDNFHIGAYTAPATAGDLFFHARGADEIKLVGGAGPILEPITDDHVDLGTDSKRYKGLHGKQMTLYTISGTPAGMFMESGNAGYWTRLWGAITATDDVDLYFPAAGPGAASRALVSSGSAPYAQLDWATVLLGDAENFFSADQHLAPKGETDQPSYALVLQSRTAGSVLKEATIQAIAAGDLYLEASTGVISLLDGLGGAVLTTSSSAITPAVDIIPSADNAYDLGSSSYKYKDGYFAGTVTTNSVSASGTITGGTVSSDWNPTSTTTYDLGSSTYRWGALYAQNINFSGAITGGTVDSHWTPNMSATYDLGSSTYRWKDAHFSGTIYVGGTGGYSGTMSCSAGQAVKTLNISGGIVTGGSCGVP